MRLGLEANVRRPRRARSAEGEVPAGTFFSVDCMRRLRAMLAAADSRRT
jgi:hypothetical protein